MGINKARNLVFKVQKVESARGGHHLDGLHNDLSLANVSREFDHM